MKDLLQACVAGNLENVKELVESGLDVDDVAVPKWLGVGNKYSPLDVACKGGHLEVVKYLIGKGADVSSNSHFPIAVANGYGHIEIVDYLIDNGADPTAIVKGWGYHDKLIEGSMFIEWKKYALLMLLSKDIIHKDIKHLIIDKFTRYKCHYGKYFNKMKYFPHS